MRGQHGAAIIDAAPVHQRGQVIPDRGSELGLGIEQFKHRHVRHDRTDMGVEHLALDSGGYGLAAQVGAAGVEARIG